MLQSVEDAALGARIDPAPAPRPGRVTLTGLHVTLAPLTLDHAASLHELSRA